jgi:hypothetical protein
MAWTCVDKQLAGSSSSFPVTRRGGASLTPTRPAGKLSPHVLSVPKISPWGPITAAYAILSSIALISNLF